MKNYALIEEENYEFVIRNLSLLIKLVCFGKPHAKAKYPTPRYPTPKYPNS